MIPKEKATELVNNMTEQFKYNMSLKNSKVFAKRCAIIAVDEILELRNKDKYNATYWFEVKAEIETL